MDMAQSMAQTDTDLKVQSTHSPLESLTTLLHEDMEHVNATILQDMHSDVPLIPQLAGYLIASGGKRIRPLLTLATSRLLNTDMEHAYTLAAAVEFIHTATLLHDDVVDESTERRGQTAANLVFGNQETVLVGDFLFSRAFQLMVRTNNFDVLRILSETSSIIAEGEVLQLQYQRSLSIDWSIYKKIIGAKTASLFSAACEVSGALAQDEESQKALKAYGYNLGMAFQITDDTLDYDAKQAELGKSLGDDFREGKITAPILFALEDSTEEEKIFWERTLVQHIIQEGDLEQATALMHKYDALKRSKDLAEHYAQKAKKSLEKIEKNCLNKDILRRLQDLPFSLVSRLF